MPPRACLPVSTGDFRDFVAKSPFKPLQKHMSLAVECTEKIPLLVELALAGDKAALKEHTTCPLTPVTGAATQMMPRVISSRSRAYPCSLI